ncbi:MAG: T9SS type A sorting domain-containing protein [Bacteroidia bacterium]
MTKSQAYMPYSCNQSTEIATYTFYPNSTTNFTNTGGVNNGLYLCGSNTTVYDTTNTSCARVFMNANCTYVLKSMGPCAGDKLIYMKGNSTVIIKSSIYAQGYIIYKEPSSTVINQSTATVNSTVCPSVSLPPISCAVGVQELNVQRPELIVSPNPTNGIITIEILNNDLSAPSELKIINALGQEMKREALNDQQQVDLSGFSQGLYILQLFQNGKVSDSKKIIKN